MKAMGKVLRGAVGIGMLAVFIGLAIRFLAADELRRAFSSLLASPVLLMIITASYAGSFVLKAVAWRLYAGAEQSLAKHLAPIGYSLFVNHLLPVKLGDLVRTGLVSKLERKTWDESLHFVAALRIMDMFILLLFGACGLAAMGLVWQPGKTMIFTVICIAGIILLFAILRYAHRSGNRFASRQLGLLHRLRSRQAAGALLITAASWVLEAAVPFGILIALHTPILFLESIWLNSMTVAGQLFHIAPGGIGTYETTMSASLAALGIDGRTALTAAIVSHAYKFAFSFAAGIFSWIVLPVQLDEGIRWLSRRRTGKVEPANETRLPI